MKLSSVSFLAVLGLVPLALPSCQTPGKTVSMKTSVVCPSCNTETKTAAIAGLTYHTHVCPQCKSQWTPGPGKGLAGQVHTCDHCKQIVEKCPLCSEKG